MQGFRKAQKTILLVDDEEIDRAKASQILSRPNCTFLQAESYTDAIRTFHKHLGRIDLLIADVSLPDGNAFDLALQLRNYKPDLPVILVSGLVGAELCRFYGLELTDPQFLRKPFTAAQLTDTVRRVLRAAAAPFSRQNLKTRSA